jgi:hypothetical protein
MLRTDDRLLLTEALAPPVGYAADLLIGTTYSLNLSALLAVPLGLTFADWEEADGSPTPDPVAALEAVRRHAERITIFCQAGATAASEQPPLVASWLEDVVVPVTAPFDGVFHPKVWVARYRHPHLAPRYRFVCGSRNLTFDRCWDTVLVVDGELTPRGGAARETRPLADFVSSLPGLATGSVAPARATAIAELAAELRRVRFQPPERFSDLSFWPLGIPGHRADPLAATRRSRMLVISPFVGLSRLQHLDSEHGNSVLVSRAEELSRIPTAKLGDFSKVCALDEPDPLEDATQDSGILTGLHAKLYVADAGWDAHVWTGSANATSAAFVHNVEFLVRLDGKRSVCGVDAVLGSNGDGDALSSMLVDVPLREVGEEVDLRTRLERELDDAAHRLAGRHLVATVEETHDAFDYRAFDYRVQLASDDTVDLSSGIAVTCWPLTRREDLEAAVVRPQSTVLARFEHQPLADITAFYVFALTLAREEVVVSKRMVVRADLEGAPHGRREAILRDLLKDPQQVLRLLRTLLAFDSEADFGAGTGLLSQLGARGRDGYPQEAPLLELLLRALDEAPEKLDAIAELIDHLKLVEDVLPPGLLQIWEPIRAVHQQATR